METFDHSATIRQDRVGDGVGLLAYFGGKAVANAVSRYDLYAGAAIAAVAC